MKHVKLWLKPITRDRVPVGMVVYAVGIPSFDELTAAILAVRKEAHQDSAALYGRAVFVLLQGQDHKTIERAAKGYNVRVRVTVTQLLAALREDPPKESLLMLWRCYLLEAYGIDPGLALSNADMTTQQLAHDLGGGAQQPDEEPEDVDDEAHDPA